MDERRTIYGAEQEGFALADNCTAHEGDVVDDIYTENGIVPVALIPHSSHKTQILDVGLFGNVKSAQSRIRLPAGVSNQTAQIAKMLSAWNAIAHPAAITSAWRQVGINPYLNEEKGYLCVEVDGRARMITDDFAFSTVRRGLSKKRFPIGSNPENPRRGLTHFQIRDMLVQEFFQDLVAEGKQMMEMKRPEIPVKESNDFWDPIIAALPEDDPRDPDFKVDGDDFVFNGPPRRSPRLAGAALATRPRCQRKIILRIGKG